MFPRNTVLGGERGIVACERGCPATEEPGGYQPENRGLQNGYSEQDKPYPRIGCFGRVIVIIAVLCQCPSRYRYLISPERPR